MAVTATGKRAVTHYRLLERFGMSAALVECRLETGRTHQIRVHMANMGHALIGDPLYGRSNRASDPDPIKTFKRQALHAAILGFEHPISHEKLQFESSLPIDMEQFLARLRDNFE
jgi:23S rRNA pseudouridine1911/1915/1917 synthase